MLHEVLRKTNQNFNQINQNYNEKALFYFCVARVYERKHAGASRYGAGGLVDVMWGRFVTMPETAYPTGRSLLRSTSTVTKEKAEHEYSYDSSQPSTMTDIQHNIM